MSCFLSGADTCFEVKLINNIIRRILGLRLGSIETSVHQPDPWLQTLTLMGHISRLMKRPTDERGFLLSGQREGLNAEQNYWVSRQRGWEEACVGEVSLLHVCMYVKINMTGSSRIHGLQVWFNKSELMRCLETATTCSLDSIIHKCSCTFETHHPNS